LGLLLGVRYPVKVLGAIWLVTAGAYLGLLMLAGPWSWLAQTHSMVLFSSAMGAGLLRQVTWSNHITSGWRFAGPALATLALVWIIDMALYDQAWVLWTAGAIVGEQVFPNGHELAQHAQARTQFGQLILKWVRLLVP